MIIKRTIAFILALIVILLVDAPLFTAYGAWAMLLCPIVGWCIGWVFIPSEKTMYTMAAVYAGQKIAETTEAQQIGNDAFDVLKGILAKAKRELAEENPKK